MKQEKPRFRPETDSRHNTERDTGVNIPVPPAGDTSHQDDFSDDEEYEQKDEERNINPFRHVNKDAPQSQVASDSTGHQQPICDTLTLLVTFLTLALSTFL